MTRPDPDEWTEVVVPGAFDDTMPVMIPVRCSQDGPVIGAAVVSADEDGLAAELRVDGGPAR